MKRKRIIFYQKFRYNTTFQRLGGSGGFTTLAAGDKRAISHEMFSGVTPAIVPNRML